MNKKNELKTIRLQIQAGQATPSSSIGPALGQQGVNIMAFCKQFNEHTKNHAKLPVSVVVTVYPDKSFKFIVKQPPASVLIKDALGISLGKKPGHGSSSPGKKIIGFIDTDQLKLIAQTKMKDLNAYDLDSAIKIIEGTAKSMGIDVKK